MIHFLLIDPDLIGVDPAFGLVIQFWRNSPFSHMPKIISAFKKNKDTLEVNWRIVWYSVLIWFLAIVLSGFIILPWYYLALPIGVFLMTIFYFKKSEKTIKSGLWISLLWFTVISFLDFIEIIGPYFGNAEFYFSDFRVWLKYPLVLLMPVIYSLIWENMNIKKLNDRSFMKNPRFQNSLGD